MVTEGLKHVWDAMDLALVANGISRPNLNFAKGMYVAGARIGLNNIAEILQAEADGIEKQARTDALKRELDDLEDSLVWDEEPPVSESKA